MEPSYKKISILCVLLCSGFKSFPVRLHQLSRSEDIRTGADRAYLKMRLLFPRVSLDLKLSENKTGNSRHSADLTDECRTEPARFDLTECRMESDSGTSMFFKLRFNSATTTPPTVADAFEEGSFFARQNERHIRFASDFNI